VIKCSWLVALSVLLCRELAGPGKLNGLAFEPKPYSRIAVYPVVCTASTVNS
jgi:hypothetical protein